MVKHLSNPIFRTLVKILLLLARSIIGNFLEVKLNFALMIESFHDAHGSL